MTNPSDALRLLITYAICIPLAIFVGYLLTVPMDYSSLGLLGIVFILLISPLFIKWYYPFLLFGLSAPMTCFFLLGSPPLWQVAVIISLGIAVVERTVNANRKFLSAPMMVWPLLFIAALVLITAKLTGGINLHAMGGEGGGGRKYVNLLLGIAAFFALTCRSVPPDRRRFYLMLFFLPAIFGVFSDLALVLPSPFNYIGLLFPPTTTYSPDEMELNPVATLRFRGLSFAAAAVPYYLLARYGLRGIFLANKWWRPVVLAVFFGLSMLGGFRNMFVAFVLTCVLMFFLEGLHRTRLVLIVLIAGALGAGGLGVFSDRLPRTIQRSMCFLPFKWKTDVVMDAQGSTEWRLRIWQAVWPKVPQYLVLGKGYSLSREDFEMIGQGEFARRQFSHIDASEESLAISNDYHSGPFSTLICFGLWGAIGMLWLMGASTWVSFRNFRHGPPALKVFNIFMLASILYHNFSFFFIFGAFDNDIAYYAKMIGFSIAMNGGVARFAPRKTAAAAVRTTPLPARLKYPVPAGTSPSRS